MLSIIGLPKADHPFLTKDSYLDCTEMVAGYTAQQVEDLFIAQPDILLGDMSAGTRQAVRALGSNSPTLTALEKVALLAHW